MVKVLFGIVKFFDKIKLFGYIIGDENKEYFFHYSSGQFLWEESDMPLFSGKTKKYDVKKEKWIRIKRPNKGDELAYILSPEQAIAAWAYKDEYLRIQKIIDDKKKNQYRIKTQDSQIEWQGNDVKELQMKFPIKNSKNNLIFEKMQVSGEWSQCDDPRLELLEQARIQEELYR